MYKKQMADMLIEALQFANGDGILEDFGRVDSFDEGITVTMMDGSVFQMDITQSRLPDEIDEKPLEVGKTIWLVAIEYEIAEIDDDGVLLRDKKGKRTRVPRLWIEDHLAAAAKRRGNV